MNLDIEEIRALAATIDDGNSDSLADLFIQLLEIENEARHLRRPRLVKKYNEAIDESKGGA